ncbi:hypothetical protein [Mesorhizobium amorphae]|uniref:Uncharacterized protein n=1 Tax=Mesorhizobium amorphae CCNWGS0123 TaxID=1082933 RepID=G6YMB6_9HYPH|nr:hypothetical protein [Mesorhizobium amorphae]ANT54514.1 hypothetical protein A6B35_31310 [Mesorhizobium amorphae CCNWGS0123]EHH02124.1 hypothetical protein MEA186_35819 [Mesorhizobium amorphae CCNWGS0123]
MYAETLDVATGNRIPQQLQRRAKQNRTTVAIIQIAVTWLKHEAVGGDALLQRNDLTGDRVVARLRLISRLEDFSTKVTAGLAGLDRTGMRQIIRTVVRRVEIDDAHIEIIFRVPPIDGSAGPKSPSKMTSSTQHCTDVPRADLGLQDPMAPPRAGLIRRNAHP